MTDATPIDMVLHCPACGMQHIDAADDSSGQINCQKNPQCSEPCGEWCGWTNPPHRSHLCHGCGHIWRPADVPTNGVEAVKTKGKNDSPATRPAALRPKRDEEVQAILHAKHFDPKYRLKDSDRVVLAWYRLGFRDAEEAHGIKATAKEPKR